MLGLHSCRLFSSYGKRRLVSVTAHRLLIAVASLVVEKVPGSWVSIAVAHRLSCSVARGMFLDQRLNPRPLRWQADSYPLHHQGSPVVFSVMMKPEFCKPHLCFASNSVISCQWRYQRKTGEPVGDKGTGFLFVLLPVLSASCQ